MLPSKARLDQGEKPPRDEKTDEDELGDEHDTDVQANTQGPVSHTKVFKAKLMGAALDKGSV